MELFTARSYFELIAFGFGTGVYGTLIGAGGGFVLMPLLVLLYPQQNPEKLTSISLAVVFFNALSGSEAYAHMKRIDYRSGIIFALATIPGAILGAIHTSFISRRLFDGLFVILLLAASIFLLFHPNLVERPRKGSAPRQSERHLVDAAGMRYNYSFNLSIGVVVSVFVGYISSFLGIGGGIIHVPALVYLLHFPVHIATATSHFVLAIMALTGTLVHMVMGTFSHGVHQTIALAIGVVLGAQVGAYLSNRIKGTWIIRSLALALGFIGIRILMILFQGKI
ncbi:MAG: sulfite exporter TauE/SafE family protein [Thermodesulfobacteriota bacterium]|jgi:uncharacterized membrane protein YfcA|nr:MAG: sulfite exporter TauE/SafE family protein [Thermodesulfobacteriota bacterium]